MAQPDDFARGSRRHPPAGNNATAYPDDDHNASDTTIATQAPPAAYMRTSRISCDPCRKRKLRCDRVMPCSTCVRRGIPHQCYQEQDASSAAALSSSPMEGSSSRQSLLAAADVDASSPSGPGRKRQRLGDGWADSRRSSQALFRKDSTAMGSSPGHLYPTPAQDGRPQKSREEELEHLLYKCRQDLLAFATSAKDSSAALESAIKDLHTQQEEPPRPVPGPPKGANPGPPLRASRPDGLYIWQDIAPHLPPLSICEQMLAFYFEQLSIYIRINQRSAAEDMWQRLQDGAGVSENQVRIICTMLAMASGTAPATSNHLRYQNTDHFKWVSMMGSPLVSRFGDPVDNTFDRILAMGLLSIYFLFMGNNDRLFECIGATIRRGYAHGLFDERTRAWDNLTLVQKEYRRRLAWYMISLERWQAFMRQLPFALHPDYVYLSEPSFESDDVVARNFAPPPRIVHTYPMTLSDGRLQTHISARSRRVVKWVFIELVAVCHEYMREFQTMPQQKRYHRAMQIDELLENKLVEGLADTGIEHHQDLHFLRYLTCATLDAVPKERHLEVNLWVSSIFFLRCFITRRFLTDEQAPQQLRFVGLTYAQGILSTIPMLTRLVKEGKIPLQMTWSANHLLCAATTFAVVILGHDPYQGIDDGQAGHARSHTSLPSSRINKNLFPQEQAQWLADNIFTTLECLGTLVLRGNTTASVAKQILERLCGSQSELRALYRKRFSATADGGEAGGAPTPLPAPVRESGLTGPPRNSNASSSDLSQASSSAHMPTPYSRSPTVMSPNSSAPSPSAKALPPIYPSGAQAGSYVSSSSNNNSSGPNLHQHRLSGQLGSSNNQQGSGMLQPYTQNASRHGCRPLLPPLHAYPSQQMQMTSGGAASSSPQSSSASGFGRVHPAYQTSSSGLPSAMVDLRDGFAKSAGSTQPFAGTGSATGGSGHLQQTPDPMFAAPRSMNASSLLDAVLMDPVDLDFLGSSNTSDLLASLLQQDVTSR